MSRVVHIARHTTKQTNESSLVLQRIACSHSTRSLQVHSCGKLSIEYSNTKVTMLAIICRQKLCARGGSQHNEQQPRHKRLFPRASMRQNIREWASKFYVSSADQWEFASQTRNASHLRCVIHWPNWNHLWDYWNGNLYRLSGFRHRDPKTRKTQHVRLALQLFVKPGSYMVGSVRQEDADGAEEAVEQIDAKISNNELEWSTKERGSTALCALLVRVEWKAGAPRARTVPVFLTGACAVP